MGVEVHGLPISDDVDAFEIYTTSGSNPDHAPTLLGTVYREPGAALPIFRPSVGAHIVKHEREALAEERARWDREREAMEALGREHGAAAATWTLDGRSPEGAARALLIGLLSGDPAVLDALPNPPSGEWAGDPTAEELIAEAGLDVPDEPEAVEDLWRAYCDGYSEGGQHGAEHEARAWLGIPDGTDLGECGSRLDEVLVELTECEDQ